jgi:curli biogenesis system outer membrane secretion channel CsgG
MKNIRWLPLALALVLCCAPPPPPKEDDAGLRIDLPPYTGKRPAVAVLDLRNSSDFDDPRIGRGVADMLITALVGTGRFTVVERNDRALAGILKEQQLGQSGAVTAQTAARAGQLLGARAVVIGEVTEFAIRKTGVYVGLAGTKTITTRTAVDIRLVDASSGAVTAGASGVGSSSSSTSGIALTVEFGTAGFDETSIGRSLRRAVNQVAIKLAQAVDQGLIK